MSSKKTDSVTHFFGGQADETDLGTPSETQDRSEETLEGEVAVDVYQTPTHVVIVSPIAGVDPKTDIQLHAADDEITITCERKAEYDEKQHDIHIQEIFWGVCSRTVILPVPCNADKAVATYKHGILTVNVPKATSSRKKVIKVTTDE